MTKTYEAERLAAALDDRRKGIKGGVGYFKQYGGKGVFANEQIDEACSLYVAAGRIRSSHRRRVTEDWIRKLLGDYFLKAGTDRGADAVVEVTAAFLANEFNTQTEASK